MEKWFLNIMKERREGEMENREDLRDGNKRGREV